MQYRLTKVVYMYEGQLKEGDNMDDRSIVNLYLSRDERAISETDIKYGKLLRSVSHNILGNIQDAQECVSDTYLNAWNSIPPHQPNPFSSYLCKITRNLSFNRYKHIHREKRGGVGCDAVLDELSEIVSGSDSVEGEFDRKKLVNTINEFLKTLSETKRNIFIRRYWYAEGVNEIASSLGYTTVNVSTILLRTRNRLKNYLEERGFII